MGEEREQHTPIEEMDLFARYVGVADWCWRTVSGWRPLAADTVGKQLIRAIDSVGANLVEGDGRYTNADTIHFWIMARASAREAKYWIDRATTRDLISSQDSVEQLSMLSNATRMLNALIRYRRSRQVKSVIRETSPDYRASLSVVRSWESFLVQNENPYTAE